MKNTTVTIEQRNTIEKNFRQRMEYLGLDGEKDFIRSGEAVLNMILESTDTETIEIVNDIKSFIAESPQNRIGLVRFLASAGKSKKGKVMTASAKSSKGGSEDFDIDSLQDLNLSRYRGFIKRELILRANGYMKIVRGKTLTFGDVVESIRIANDRKPVEIQEDGSIARSSYYRYLSADKPKKDVVWRFAFGLHCSTEQLEALMDVIPYDFLETREDAMKLAILEAGIFRAVDVDAILASNKCEILDRDM